MHTYKYNNLNHINYTFHAYIAYISINQVCSLAIADIIFEVKDKLHTLFKREGTDLIFEPKISLLEVNLAP